MLYPNPQPASTLAPRMLPQGRHFVDDEDIDAVVRVLTSDRLTGGPATPSFEAALARTVGAHEAVACSSGGAALHLAIRALDLGPDDTVIVPAIAGVAAAGAARHAGAEVVFADVDADTGLMGPQHLQTAIGELPPTGKRALFNLHLAGQCAELQALEEVARAAGLLIVDDASQALGTEYRSRDGRWHKVGAGDHSDMTVFSFEAGDTVTMGAGGGLALNDVDLAGRIRRDREGGLERDPAKLNQPISRDLSGNIAPWAYELTLPGFDYRPSDIQAVLGTTQIKKLPGFVRERRSLVAHYDLALEAFWPIVRPLGRTPACLPAWHHYIVRVDFARAGLTRGELMRALGDNGIGTGVHYVPVARQPYYEQRYGVADLPGANAYYEATLTLPLFVGMCEDDIERVADALGELIAR
jgi:dTDP-4-amino-4,6-dideoxygalactose transaminase